ncbi:PhoU domain-containing protein [Nitrososphaera viennensis]|uniref:Phosphate uptake regulator PhoU n=2 Tax=Nitrososphaera viennensis TaxID=1034015 RepID=A0A977IFY8_9ARCH|nr:phosphate uptake regulator PhoU [Nitrososphaera viennensis]AIC15419.1 putative PhoU family protein [Nitrososphaera viennensis EN76]UVS70314.1 phosphate uptake regulator PhoU [Nitrososphaera viennensis]
MVRYARRLQQIGSSILISLPSQWVKDNNLRKGSIVPVNINRDNTISIFPSGEEAESTKEVTIQYSPASMDSLVNQVYGAYLLGYDVIRVKAAGSITYEDAERFKRAMRKLVGLEIVEEDRQTISSQFLLDPNTLDAEKILRRMNSLVAGMFREMLEAIKERENIAKRSIGGRDDEVDRQYFLLVRLIRSAMMDQQLAGKLNLSNIDILDYRIAANLLESAGDFIVDLAPMQDFARLALIDRFVQAGELVEKMQEKAVAAFAGKNRADSVEVVNMYGKFNEIMSSIKEASANADNKSPESTVAVLNLTYSLDRIARCWVDIADLVKPMHLIAPLKNA